MVYILVVNYLVKMDRNIFEVVYMRPDLKTGEKVLIALAGKHVPAIVVAHGNYNDLVKKKEEILLSLLGKHK
jgi:hypothetical protein